MLLKVIKIRDDVGVELGTVLNVDHPVTIIGRDPNADIVLVNRGISRRHVRLSTDSAGVWVENLSRFDTYLNQSRLHERTSLASGDCLQVGPVLLQVVGESDASATLEGLGPMTVTATHARAISTTTDGPLVSIDSNAKALLFGGRAVDLRPREFAVMEALALRAGQWVTVDNIADSLNADPGYIKKYVSYARGALRAELETSVELASLVRLAVREASDALTQRTDLDTCSSRDLVLELLKSRHSAGYRLSVLPHRISIG